MSLNTPLEANRPSQIDTSRLAPPSVGNGPVRSFDQQTEALPIQAINWSDASPFHAVTQQMEEDMRQVHRPWKVETGGQAGLISSFFNTAALCFGIGCLTLPYGVMKAGYAASVGILVFTGFLSFDSVRGLSQARRQAMQLLKRADTTLLDTVGKLLGRRWRHATTACVCLSQAAVCIGYEIFMCSTFEKYYPMFSFNGWLLAVQVPLIMLCAVRSMNFLGFISSLSVMAVGSGLLIASSVMLAKVQQESHVDHMQPFTDMHGAVAMFGITSLSFGGIGAVGLNVEQSMASPQSFLPILGSAVSIGVIFYCVFGALGYMAFGTSCHAVITLNFPVEEWTSKALSVSFVFQVICSFPVNMYPIWKIVEGVIFGVTARTPAELQINRERLVMVFGRSLLRTSILLVMACIVWLFKSMFATLLSVVGSCTCAFYLFFVPGLLQLQMVKPPAIGGFLAMLKIVVGIVAPLASVASLMMKN